MMFMAAHINEQEKMMITKEQALKLKKLQINVVSSEVSFHNARTRDEQDKAIKLLQIANEEFNNFVDSITKK